MAPFTRRCSSLNVWSLSGYYTSLHVVQSSLSTMAWTQVNLRHGHTFAWGAGLFHHIGHGEHWVQERNTQWPLYCGCRRLWEHPRVRRKKLEKLETAVPRSSAGALCPWIQKPLAAGASTEEKMLVLAVIQGGNSFWNSLQCVSGTF